MSNASDFIIENGVLIGYVGSDQYVSIPPTVASIHKRAFFERTDIKMVKIPETVRQLDSDVFYSCKNLKKVIITGNTTISSYAFYECYNLQKLDYYGTVFPFPEQIQKIFGYQGDVPETVLEKLMLFAPNLSLDVLKENRLAMLAAKTFIDRCLEYQNEDIANQYFTYIMGQKSKLLPLAFKKDCVELIEKMVEAGKITAKNVETDYYIPALKSNAKECCIFLEETFHVSAATQKDSNPLWNNVYFSFDGRKLLKYPGADGESAYYIPDGTEEIAAGAFSLPVPKTVYVPASVKNIRAGAFSLKKNSNITVYLPDAPIHVAAKAFDRDLYWPDVNLFTYDVKIATTFLHSINAVVYLGDIENVPVQFRHKLAFDFMQAALDKRIDASQPFYAHYVKFIRRNSTTFIRKDLRTEDEVELRWMVTNNALAEKACITLLDQVNEPELKALLMEYQRREFAGKQKRDTLSLDGIDAAMKRQIEAEVRRENIRKQIGIQGIVFVSSGDLAGFGKYNEYTEIYDLSDLKAYIEERGGFYRTAVSSKTDYLICNDPSRETTKVEKAKDLNVPIITEQEFLALADPQEKR